MTTISEGEMSIELRLNNAVFRCMLEDKYYNIKDRKAYGVRNIKNVVPTEKGLMLTGDVLIVCDKCFKDSDLHLEEPSQIVVPTIDAQRVKDTILTKNGKTPVKA